MVKGCHTQYAAHTAAQQRQQQERPFRDAPASLFSPVLVNAVQGKGHYVDTCEPYQQCGVDYELDTPEEVATAFHVKQVLGQEGGLLVTNPIPEEYSMDPAVINKAIDEAVAECKAKGVHGKETTPFLLAKVKDLTGGDSLDSNIQLVYNNARVASAIACSLSKLEKQG